MQPLAQHFDYFHVVIALRDRQLHPVPERGHQHCKRLHRARKHRAVIHHIGHAAFRQLEAADVGNQKAVLEHKILTDLLPCRHFFRKRHIRLVQLPAAVGRSLGAVQQLFALHLAVQKRFCALEYLLERQATVFRQIGQVDKADEIPCSRRRQQRPQIDRNLRDDRLIRLTELVVERAHEQRRDNGKRADADRLAVIMQLREREGYLCDDLGRVPDIGQFPCVGCFWLFPNACRRKLLIRKLFVTVRAFLRRPAGVHAAHRAVVLDRVAAQR